MSVVHPDAAVMEAAEGFQIEARTFSTDLHLDADVFAQLSSLDAATARGGRRAGARATPCATSGASGVDRDEDDPRAAARAQPPRERAVPDVLARHPRRAAYDAGAGGRARRPARGLRRRAPRRRRRAGRDQHRVPRHAAVPDPRAATPSSARRVAHAFLNLGWPENDAVLAELLEVREEKATLLGYADWPSYDAEVKMIGEGRRIPEFIDEIAAASEEAGRREIEELLRAGARRGRGRRRLLQLAPPRRGGQARAVRGRRPGGAPLLRRRQGAPGAARRHGSALRPRATSRWTPRRGTPR